MPVTTASPRRRTAPRRSGDSAVTRWRDGVRMEPLTVIVTVEDVEAEPSGRLMRAMIRGPGKDVELIGPRFAGTTAALREQLAVVCERMIELLEPPTGRTVT